MLKVGRGEKKKSKARPHGFIPEIISIAVRTGFSHPCVQTLRYSWQMRKWSSNMVVRTSPGEETYSSWQRQPRNDECIKWLMRERHRSHQLTQCQWQPQPQPQPQPPLPQTTHACSTSHLIWERTLRWGWPVNGGGEMQNGESRFHYFNIYI